MMKSSFIIFLLLLFSVISRAQGKKITGTVIGVEDKKPILGAMVAVKNTDLKTLTNSEGKFTLQLPNTATALVISNVEMQTKEVAIDGKSQFTIELSPLNSKLDEMIVVAYGTAKKGSYTGAVSQIKADKFNERPITNVTSAILGTTPGVQVSTANGQPGSEPNIFIRGVGTISSSVSSDPLIILNGMPYNNPMSNINPNDIESISILKDASSAALYGARAANGVIMIQTKSGSKNKTTVNVKLNQGLTTKQTADYNKVGVEDFLTVYWESTKNQLIRGGMDPVLAGQTAAKNLITNNLKYNPYNVPDDQVLDANGKLNPNATFMWGDDTNWLNAVQQLGSRTDADVSVSGGNAKSDYYLSAGYLKEKGYIVGTQFDRYTINANLNSKLTDFLKIGGTVSGNMSKSMGEQYDKSGNNSNAFRFTRYIGPIYPIHIHNPLTKEYVRNAEGNLIYDFGTGYQITDDLKAPSRDYVGGFNPALELQNIFDGFKRNTINSKLYTEISFTKDLKLTLNGSVAADARTSASATVVYPERQNNGSATRTSSFRTTWTFNQLLNYSKNFNNHHIDVLAGHESYDYEYNFLTSSMSDQKVINTNYELSNYATPGDQSSKTDKYKTEGYLSRINYDYSNRYFLSASVRRDGTSRFYKDARWGTFYSIGGGWRIDQEKFMQNLSFVDLLKLRVSYGGVGNDDIGTYYAWQATYEPATNGLEPGYIKERVLNSQSLQWEVSHSSDFAVEFGLFKSKLTGSIEFFNRQSSNLLFKVPQPPDAGITYAYQNAGTMYNRGVEIDLNSVLVRTNDFKWSLGVNGAFIKNKITSLPIDPYNESVYRIEQGHSRYEFYLRQWAGVDPATGNTIYKPTVDVLNAYMNETDPAKKNAAIVEVNGNYYTTKVAEAVYDWSGNAMPKLSGGFNSGISWKGLTLNVLFNYQLGGKMYDVGYGDLMTGPSGSAQIGSTRHTDIMKRWQKPGDITTVPRMDDFSSPDMNAGSSTRWLVNSNMLELANVTLNYDISKKILEKYSIQSLRIFASADNALLFTKRKGMYPRRSVNSGYSSNIDVYLPARVFSLGLSLTL